jgi:hypothetical protein
VDQVGQLLVAALLALRLFLHRGSLANSHSKLVMAADLVTGLLPNLVVFQGRLISRHKQN